MTFEKRLVAGWGDMDFNSHMRNTAYLDMLPRTTDCQTLPTSVR